MKKEYVISIIVFLGLVLFASCFVNAVDESTATGYNVPQSEERINKGFTCLENKTLGKANSFSIEDVSLVILASPKSEVLSQYRSRLLNETKVVSDTQNCWPKSSCTIKATALAVLALNHLGEDTQKGENWLLSKNKTASEITWLLQEDSSSETKCRITYDNQNYETNIGIDKKIGSSAGSCLGIYSNNFWFQVSQNCYDKEFAIACDRDFIINLLYKRAGSSNAYYVDSNTQTSPALGTATIKVDSKCFGLTSCDYEGSLWATWALLKTGNNIQSYVPYLTALADTNKAYFPGTFLYLITGFEDYANNLIKDQELGNYWVADGSANGKFYDTALALIALKSSSSDQVARAKKQMEFFQDISGCWMSSNNNQVRDTAMLLWALAGRAPSIINVAPSTTCAQANYFCIDAPLCSDSDKRPNYYCGTQTCCITQNLQTCTQQDGKVCSSGKECTGNVKVASDTNDCCVDECEEPVTTTECEANGDYCQTSCSSNQKETQDDCGSAMVCCQTATTPEPTGKSNWWIWLLIFGIIIIIAIIAYIQRDKIKMWSFKRNNNVKNEGNNRPGFAPGPGSFRPSFPPNGGMPSTGQRQMPMRPMFSQAKPIVPVKNSPPVEDDETFRKLREMSK